MSLKYMGGGSQNILNFFLTQAIDTMIQYIFLTLLQGNDTIYTWQIALKWARKYFENDSNFKTAISETEKNFENLIAPNDSLGSKTLSG